MFERIVGELREHAPFTAFGAATGIVILAIVVLIDLPLRTSEFIFYTLHPAHVLLSAVVTTALWRRYGRAGIWRAVMVGYAGSVGVSTISDSLIPYVGEVLFDLPLREAHIGFVEKWWIVNPVAAVGMAIGYFRPATKLPHAGHVLLSTWASLFHLVMALGGSFSWVLMLPLFVFLFLAVIVPCCVSDIVFPLLFAGEKSPSHAH